MAKSYEHIEKTEKIKGVDRMVENMEKIKIVYKHHPSKKVELVFGAGYQRIADNLRRTNYTLDGKSSTMKHPFSCVTQKYFFIFCIFN